MKLLAIELRRILEVLRLQSLQKNFWAHFLDLCVLFAVKFRRLLEVLCLQRLHKTLWAYFHDLCVQKRSCLLLS